MGEMLVIPPESHPPPDPDPEPPPRLLPLDLFLPAISLGKSRGMAAITAPLRIRLPCSGPSTESSMPPRTRWSNPSSVLRKRLVSMWGLFFCFTTSPLHPKLSLVSGSTVQPVNLYLPSILKDPVRAIQSSLNPLASKSSLESPSTFHRASTQGLPVSSPVNLFKERSIVLKNYQGTSLCFGAGPILPLRASTQTACEFDYNLLCFIANLAIEPTNISAKSRLVFSGFGLANLVKSYLRERNWHPSSLIRIEIILFCPLSRMRILSDSNLSKSQTVLCSCVVLATLCEVTIVNGSTNITVSGNPLKSAWKNQLTTLLVSGDAVKTTLTHPKTGLDSLSIIPCDETPIICYVLMLSMYFTLKLEDDLSLHCTKNIV